MGVTKTSPGRDMFLLLLVICHSFRPKTLPPSRSSLLVFNIWFFNFNSQHGHLVCFGGKASVCWRCCLQQLQHRKKIIFTSVAAYPSIQHTKGAWLTAQIRDLVIGHRQIEVVDDIGHAVKCEKRLLVQPKSKTT